MNKTKRKREDEGKERKKRRKESSAPKKKQTVLQKEENDSPFGTKVVNVKVAFLRDRGYANFGEWAKEENHVYIGRDMSFYVPGAKASKWKNPFPVKKHGMKSCLDLFENHLLSSPSLLSSVQELRGKELGCWCAPSQCHGDILRKYADRVNEQEKKEKEEKEEKEEEKHGKDKECMD
uniref:DUF4326 domain-containing protein n=1 Tax=Paramoeba aestuarina TaxID=180227 RepID=A0A7S4NSD2_9EUKA|mmetsp:Transcript_24689/g.38487  ORF Transcript_24689/g.38487 Transcript_24689/m.38487 type:complete len:178 (+) Transcript_24689:96-629(+)